MQQELVHNNVLIPYEAIMYRMFPEKNCSGEVLVQMLNKLRNSTLKRGGWVPPQPGRVSDKAVKHLDRGHVMAYLDVDPDTGKEKIVQREIPWSANASTLINEKDIEKHRKSGMAPWELADFPDSEFAINNRKLSKAERKAQAEVDAAYWVRVGVKNRVVQAKPQRRNRRGTMNNASSSDVIDAVDGGKSNDCTMSTDNLSFQVEQSKSDSDALLPVDEEKPKIPPFPLDHSLVVFRLLPSSRVSSKRPPEYVALHQGNELEAAENNDFNEMDYYAVGEDLEYDGGDQDFDGQDGILPQRFGSLEHGQMPEHQIHTAASGQALSVAQRASYPSYFPTTSVDVQNPAVNYSDFSVLNNTRSQTSFQPMASRGVSGDTNVNRDIPQIAMGYHPSRGAFQHSRLGQSPTQRILSGTEHFAIQNGLVASQRHIQEYDPYLSEAWRVYDQLRAQEPLANAMFRRGGSQQTDARNTTIFDEAGNDQGNSAFSSVSSVPDSSPSEASPSLENFESDVSATRQDSGQTNGGIVVNSMLVS
jgi:hypothetical protein